MAGKPDIRLMLSLLFMVFCFAGVELISAATNSDDISALLLLKAEWKNLPPSWGKSNDPCGAPWEGVTCKDSRVTELHLSTMNLEGELNGNIGGLLELTSLDLSYNRGLKGPISPQIGNLKRLSSLYLLGCGFTGSIPKEIGNLAELTILSLNSNNFSGSIPPSLGSLSKLTWFDIADNQLTGSLPISSDTTPGLDMLLRAKHFHFNKNRLSGGISKLFSSEMELIHILFDGNQFTGEIPATLGLLKHLEVLRLDRNSLGGTVPLELHNISTLNELNLANNQLTGSIPDLSQMNNLIYVDLSNNSFDPSKAPNWFSTLEQLAVLVMENGNLQGPVPELLFSLPDLKQVLLKGNHFNDSLDMGTTISQQLKLVDLEDNKISTAEVTAAYHNVLILIGNPVCRVLSQTDYCITQQQKESYSTSLTHCGSKLCASLQRLNPQSCDCTVPYEGDLVFRAPPFRDLSNATLFHSLETKLWTTLGLSYGSVSLQNLVFKNDTYLHIELALFPSASEYFTRTEVQRIGFNMSNQTFKPPSGFGPFYFLAYPYPFPDEKGGTSMSLGMIIGIAVGCAVLIFILILVGVYAVRQKKRAERAIEQSRPFASWASSGKESGGAPQLKGARWFTYDELNKCTNNFSNSNQIGSGSYGKVYRGMLSHGQVVAVKRAQQGSMQGGLEFKTEIELLSRVHHKNLVSLIGFCFEQGEQMLVYEFFNNGTIRDSLSGRSGIYLDWKRRLHISLGSARGLAYLHEHANPPIIHRDIKSSNILLDENLTAKVSDFGLSKLLQDTAKGDVSTQVKGTLGYLDPEYYMTQQLTEKTDVYSFGVVMLELVSGKQPIDKGKYIVREVQIRLDTNDRQHYGLKELIDPNIRNEVPLIGFGRFVELAMECVGESAAGRPRMSDVEKEIETILHNNELNTNPTSASSSATSFVKEKGGHLYNDVLPEQNATNSDTFDYSGGYPLSAKVNPK